jgi:hypothetical protein
MRVLGANKYRDLTVDEIIMLAETQVRLMNFVNGWGWVESGKAYEGAGDPRFSTKLDAADDAVCVLGLDQ